ncbi:MAG: ATP-binding protein [Gammaproteobacteria bacterium]|nr:ATP-binding protein [Gammaproteobacteria bacterium]
MSMIKRLFSPAKQSFFLFGPRGTGKSTWLKTQYPHALSIDLLDPSQLRLYQAYPERLEQTVHAAQTKTIVIDEIQKAPELLSVVHRLIEQKQEWQFILTGSSARKLKRAGVDLLAGRAVIRHMHPFIAAELKDQFSLEKALEQGLVPLVVESTDILDTLKAYIGIYLTEEVKAEGLVRNIGSFARFLEVMSFSHSTILNLSNIARECAASRKLIEGYLSVLEDLLLSYQLSVFSLRAKRQLVAHHKFYYFDVGVYRSLRMTGFLDKTAEINGPGLEGLVLQHLRAWNDYHGQPNKLYYWRTKHGVEIDFIIYGADGLYAIEVKNSLLFHEKDMNGLKTFCTDYPEATAILLYRGQEWFKKDNVWCIPVDIFLQQLGDVKLHEILR